MQKIFLRIYFCSASKNCYAVNLISKRFRLTTPTYTEDSFCHTCKNTSLSELFFTGALIYNYVFV